MVFKKKVLMPVFFGMICIVFLSLLTDSFYKNALNKIGVGEAENKTEYSYHFAMIVTNASSEFWQDIYSNMAKEAEAEDAYVELKGKMPSDLYDLSDYMDMSIAAGVDGILLEYNGDEELSEKIDEAVEKGIPVVTMVSDAPNSKRNSFVGVNDYRLSMEYGQEILSLLPSEKEKVNVTILTHRSESEEARSQIFERLNSIFMTSDEIAGRVSLEEINVPADSYFATEEIIWNRFRRGNAPDVIVCRNELDTEAVYQALIDYNLVGRTKLIGYYRSENTLEGIRHGPIASSLCIDTNEIGMYSIRALMECIDSGRTNSFYNARMQFVDEDNIGAFLNSERKRSEETAKTE